MEEFTSFTTASPSFAFVVAEAADDDDEEGRRRIAWRTQYPPFGVTYDMLRFSRIFKRYLRLYFV